MGHVRDRWTRPGEAGRRVRTERWGHGQRWQALHTGQDGRQESATFQTRDAAQMWVAQRQAGLQAPRPSRGGILLTDWARQWRAGQLHWRDGTAASARIAVEHRITPTLGHLELGQITRADIQAAVATWTAAYAPSTVRVTYSYLTGMLRTALADGLLEADPTVGVRLPPKPKGRLHLLTIEQVKALEKSVTPRLADAVVVAAATGLRPGEWRSLTWDRIDLPGGTLTVDRQLGADGTWGPPKSQAGVRTITLGEVGVAALRRQLALTGDDGAGLVFTTRRGRPYGRGDLSNAWTRATGDGERWAGLPPRSGWHDLRHFHASLLIAGGMSVRAVADRLGHADISETLSTYAHLWPSDDERSAAIVDGALGMLGASTQRPEAA